MVERYTFMIGTADREFVAASDYDEMQRGYQDNLRLSGLQCGKITLMQKRIADLEAEIVRLRSDQAGATQEGELTESRAPSKALPRKMALLADKLEIARGMGLDGFAMAGRIEGDLERLVSSALINCVELIAREERALEFAKTFGAAAALQYAAGLTDCADFLGMWNQGDYIAIRNRWPGCPESIFVDMPSPVKRLNELG